MFRSGGRARRVPEEDENPKRRGELQRVLSERLEVAMARN